MAQQGVKIENLPAVQPLTGAELVPVVQDTGDGTLETRKATASGFGGLFVKLVSAVTQIINGDIALSNGKLLLGVMKDGRQENLVGVKDYGTYEQVEVGSEHDPMCLNHNAKSPDGTVVGKNIIVNYTDASGVNQADAVAYLSDIINVVTNWWNNIKSTAQTISGLWTFNSNVTFNGANNTAPGHGDWPSSNTTLITAQQALKLAFYNTGWVEAVDLVNYSILSGSKIYAPQEKTDLSLKLAFNNDLAANYYTIGDYVKSEYARLLNLPSWDAVKYNNPFAIFTKLNAVPRMLTPTTYANECFMVIEDKSFDLQTRQLTNKGIVVRFFDDGGVKKIMFGTHTGSAMQWSDSFNFSDSIFYSLLILNTGNGQVKFWIAPPINGFDFNTNINPNAPTAVLNGPVGSGAWLLNNRRDVAFYSTITASSETCSNSGYFYIKNLKILNPGIL